MTNTLHCEVSYQWHIYRITPPGTSHAECSNCTFVNGAAGAAQLLEFVMMVTIVVVVVTVWMLMTMLVVKLKSMVMTRRSRALSDPCLGRSSSVGGEYYTKQQQWVLSTSAKRFGNLLQNSTTGGALVSLSGEF